MCCGWAQGVGSHADAFAVGGDDQHDAGSGLGVGSGGVELLDVGGSPPGKGLDLAFGNVLAGGAFDGSAGLLEGPSRRLDRRQATKPVGVAFGGQVEDTVGGVEVRVATMPVGETLHVDPAEDGRQRPPVAGLNSAVRDRLGVEHRFEALAVAARRLR